MPARIRGLIAALLVAPQLSVAAQGRAEAPTSCAAGPVLMRAADTLWVADSLKLFPRQVAAMLPNAAQTVTRSDVGRGDYSAAMRAVRHAADSAFKAVGTDKFPAGFQETFLANADAAADVLARLNGSASLTNARLLDSLLVGRFRPMARETDDVGRTTFFFATQSNLEGIRIDPVAVPSPAFEAACWGLISADLVLTAFNGPLVDSTAARLAEIQQEWRNFDENRRPETALEFVLNHVRWKHSSGLHPPTRQLVFLHPVAAVLANGIDRNAQVRGGYGLELLGGIWYPASWKWKNHLGLSIISVGTASGPMQIGAYAHLSRFLSAGLVGRSTNDLSFVTSIDLARFIWNDDKALAEFASSQVQKAAGSLGTEALRKTIATRMSQ